MHSTGPEIHRLGTYFFSEIINIFVLVFSLLKFGMSKFGTRVNPIVAGILMLVILGCQLLPQLLSKILVVLLFLIIPMQSF